MGLVGLVGVNCLFDALWDWCGFFGGGGVCLLLYGIIVVFFWVLNHESTLTEGAAAVGVNCLFVTLWD